MSGIDIFWDSFDRGVSAARRPTSQRGFLDVLRKRTSPPKSVLLISEFNELFLAPSDVRNECLRSFREIRNNNNEYTVCSIAVAGIYGIGHSNPIDNNLSPFDVSDHVQNPNLTLEETSSLFHELLRH
jgi:hypothetical protein